MFFNKYPYTNFHELNLDWIISKVKELEGEIDDWMAISSIKFADPIEWDIYKAYDPYTVVLGPDGNSYLSLKPVPPGINYTNTEYWQRVAQTNAQITSVQTDIINIKDNLEILNKSTYEGIPSVANHYIGHDTVYTGYNQAQFGALCKVGKIIYGLYPNNYDNTGVIRKYDMAANTITEISSNAQMGHANSCAWDPRTNQFIVIPGNTYIGGVGTRFNGMYVYNRSWTLTDTISGMFPEDLYACAYDRVTNRLFVAAIWDTCTLYELDTDYNIINTYTFDMSKVFPNGIASGDLGPQDIAIYNNTVYLELASGMFYVATLDDLCFSNAFWSERQTANKQWLLGESEGIDIDDDGMLYQANYLSNGRFTVAFVTNVGINERVSKKNTVFRYGHDTYNLSATTKGQFAPGMYGLHSLAETMRLVQPDLHTILIGGTVTEPNYGTALWIYVWGNIAIKVPNTAIFNVGTICPVHQIAVQIMTGGTINAKAGGDSPFLAVMNTNVITTFENNGTYNETDMDGTINTSFSTTPVFIGRLERGSTVTVNAQTATRLSAWMGPHKITT